MSTEHTTTDWQSWRNELYTFADENTRIFTVANCPPLIHPIPVLSDPDMLANRSVGSLMRPQISINKFPELPFMLHKLPVADPLLSRLSSNASALTPSRFEGGWALADDIRNAWIGLEKGLVHISELLITSTDQSSCGTAARYAIRFQEHWPQPEDYGYRKLHSSTREAEIAIRRAHAAFNMLIARCSLAIALWQFPGPTNGNIPSVTTSHYDPIRQSVVPEWVIFLRQRNIPSSWIDALCDSAITDFSINMRVGTIFDPSDCTWLPIAPVLRAANVPVFVLWRGPQDSNQWLTAHPYMSSFIPPPDDADLALQHLPAGKPRVVTLCREMRTRPLPNYSALDDSTPPFGPYQLPRESRAEFLDRRERYRPDQERAETMLQKQWRHSREAHASSGNPPFRRSRVYLWVKPDLVYPDLPPRWANYEYRHPIPPPAYRSIWMVHPENSRKYNAHYDEWDLWFPKEWQSDEEEWWTATSSTVRRPLRTGAQDLNHGILLPEEHGLLNPTPEEREIGDVMHPQSFFLHSWYGITLGNTKVFAGIEYDKWAQKTWHLFGEVEDTYPSDAASKQMLAGWVSAVMDRDWKSRALEVTWDLDERNPAYILGAQNPDPRLSISLDHLRSPDNKDDPDNTLRWVLVKFHAEQDRPPWSLLTSPLGTLYVMRRLSEVDTRAAALRCLLCAGIPARTGLWLASPPAQVGIGKPTGMKRYLRVPWQKKGEWPTLQDFDAYCQRVLELAQSPHARAAWLKGGIVWRIMAEVTGKHPQSNLNVSHLEELDNGPSGMTDHYQAVTLDSKQAGYYDDALSRAELDIIAGVVRVYTGRGEQTEDASWWPKHSAWVRAGAYTGKWSTSDERWFQSRLRSILEEREGPLNAGQWKDRLRRQKKSGVLADHVEECAWDFTYRNFVERTRQSSVE